MQTLDPIFMKGEMLQGEKYFLEMNPFETKPYLFIVQMKLV